MKDVFQLTFGTPVAQAKQQTILKFGAVKRITFCYALQLLFWTFGRHAMHSWTLLTL